MAQCIDHCQIEIAIVSRREARKRNKRGQESLVIEALIIEGYRSINANENHELIINIVELNNE